MAKGQMRSNKEAKKPKKDAATSKPISRATVMPTMNPVVAEKNKKK